MKKLLESDEGMVSLKKNYLIVLFVLIVSCTVNNNENNYREFYGVKINELSDSGYEEKSTPLSNEESAALAAVVIYYGLSLKYTEGTIYIPQSEFNDLNLLYNITIKSNDSIWFNEHISPH